MSESLGSLCLVLHGHLPYVLNHGTYPHGEAWLFEAAAETYLPLLDLIGECALLQVRPAISVGLTPILLEQLTHDRFKQGFIDYLNERAGRAADDRREFEAAGNAQLATLATRWEDWFRQKLAHFERIGRNIPAEFAARVREGHIQVLTSNATHAYMPLLLNDQMCHAQMAAGMATSERILGIRPTGMWLPECAYRPATEHWIPAVLYDDARRRCGLEEFIAGAGVSHFFVDTHLVQDATPLGVWEAGQFRPINDVQVYWDQQHGWRSPLEPVGVASSPGPPRAVAFARHPAVSQQVWSSQVGYPGHSEYLDFHRKHGQHGLRYHRVTSRSTPMHEKQPYEPDHSEHRTHADSQHFCNVVRDVLSSHRFHTGRQGVVVAPFDAELFGHWWFEGPRFLRDVILTLAHDPAVELMTVEEATERHPTEMVVRMPEGSWGEKGNHSVWLNDRTRWIWEMEYRAEGRFLSLLHELPWQSNGGVRQIMEKAARQLLLLQASDWPFVIHSHGAVDYGIQRFAGHATRFDRLATIAQSIAAGRDLTPIQQAQVAEADAHDNVFEHIDLSWWMGP